jgi:surface polysaccharide O-acyltransferase-like enzyme
MAYGGEGTWHYEEGQADIITSTVLTLFVAVCQAFFMGFFFLIAAYFVPRSQERRGGKQFLKDRFLRLGVPLAFQLLVIAPLLSYGLGITIWGFDGPFWVYMRDYWKQVRGLDVGPLWFLEALLIFSLVYALWWRLTKARAQKVRGESAVPGNRAVAIFALAVGLVTFIVRVWLPVDWFYRPLNFKLAHFPQYIGLFILGTVAYRRGWLSALSEDAARGRLWGRVAILLVVFAPVLFAAGGALQGGAAPFLGGFHWQALIYALWEQLLCVAMVISLLVLFRRRYDHQGSLARTMSDSAYAIYILHAPILVFVSLGLRSIELYPLLKFLLASLVSLPLCLLAGRVARLLPLARRVL